MDSNPMRHPSPTKKMKCSFLDYIQLLMIGRAGQWIQTPSATRLQPEKWNAYFWITFNFWWSARLINGLKPHPPALSSQKKWNAHFWITFTFWWSAGLVDGLKPHLPPLSRHKIKCSFLHYVQLVMIARAGQWTQTHLPPLSSQKNEMLIFGLCSISDIRWPGWWTRTPSATSLPPKKWYAYFCITFNFWWSARLVDELESHLPPLSSQKMKCSFLDYAQLLMISWAGQWTQTTCATSLQA